MEDVEENNKTICLYQEKLTKTSFSSYSIYLQNSNQKKMLSLIEVNPLIVTKQDNDLLCLDAKINFDDNALYRHPDIVGFKRYLVRKIQLKLRLANMDLAYIKLNGKIGCMVNGAGLSNGNFGYH